MTEPFHPTDDPAQTPPRPAPGAAWGPPAAPKGPYLPPTGPAPSSTSASTSASMPAGSVTSSFGGPDAATMPMIPVQTTSAPRRSRGKTMGAVIGVTAIVAAGSFAVVSISGNDDAGGAASPTEVGTSLTAALDNEDVLGVVDLLLPGERDTFRDPLIRTVDNLVRLQALADGASLDSISGVDIQFSDVQVREEPTNVDDIVNIFLSGSSSAIVDGNKVPIGDLLLDEVFDGERPTIDAPSSSDDFQDVQMTVVERDGRWYLSAFYSIAEQARGDADIPATGVLAKGADEPDGAVDQMLQAIGDQDLGDLIAGIDPTEAEALQRYAPLFLDDVQATADDAGVDWSIDNTSYTVEGSGDRRTVTVDSFTFTIKNPDGDSDIVVSYADKCMTVSINGDETKTCGVGQGDLGDLADELNVGDNTAITDLLDAFGKAFDDYDPSGIGVHRVDGQWYVSPLSTMFDGFNDVLDALSRDEVNAVIDAVKGLGDFTDLPGAVQDGIGTDFAGTATSDPTTSDPAATDDTASDGTSDQPADAIDLCYQQLDAAAGVQCMQDGIADGSIDPTYVNVAFRFPECGAAEAYWSSVYSMSDADFVALVEQVSPCFLGLVATGTIDAYELPSEFLDPTCLEGKNWYTTFDDAYNERFYACTSTARDAL